MTAAERLIEPELAAFLEGEAAQYVGTVTAAGMPSAGRAWGLRVRAGGPHIRLLVGADVETVASVHPGTGDAPARLALSVTDVLTFRSVQLKGTVVGVEEPDESDLAVHHGYRAGFSAAVAATGGVTPMEAVWPPALVAVTVEVDAVFDQTPGPNAGARLRGEPA
jgi:hypothetical protein